MAKVILMIIGMLSVALGIIGIVLPLLPTTPLILLGAYCFFRSSETLYNKLLSHKYLGKIIKEFQKEGGIPLKTKIFAIAILWLSILFATLVIIQQLVINMALWCIALAVSVYIGKYR